MQIKIHNPVPTKKMPAARAKNEKQMATDGLRLPSPLLKCPADLWLGLIIIRNRATASSGGADYLYG
jgi:hypothetical protein